MELEELKYPVGKFSPPTQVSKAQLDLWINEIKDLPGLLEKEIANLSPEDYKKQYRPGGWNITQVIHHLADSHINCFVRFKLALTEDSPTIKAYLEDKWGEMSDNTDLDPHVSLDILKALHIRWTYLMEHMSESDFKKGFIHPQKNRLVNLEEATALYAWHCRHHLAHIRNAKSF